MQYCTFESQTGEKRQAILAKTKAGNGAVQWKALEKAFNATLVELNPGGNPPTNKDTYTKIRFEHGITYAVTVTKNRGVIPYTQSTMLPWLLYVCS